jgi:hypothetical protein
MAVHAPIRLKRIGSGHGRVVNAQAYFSSMPFGKALTTVKLYAGQNRQCSDSLSPTPKKQERPGLSTRPFKIFEG